MNICFSLTNLSLGGAQLFVIRLAGELASRLNKTVYIYDHWPEYRNNNILQNIDPRVKIISYSESTTERWLIWKANALLKKLKIKRSFRHDLNAKRFGKAMERHAITIVNSHMSYSDFVVAGCRLPAHCHFIPTLHGEYELMLENNDSRDYFIKKIRKVLSKAAAIIYTADKNLEPIKNNHPENKVPVTKINIGFNQKIFTLQHISKTSLGFNATDFVTGMISRGIPEKGWDTAIAAVQAHNARQSDKIKLVLIGDGSYLAELVKKTNDPNIRLIQFENNFQDYFSYYKIFDVLIFPTRFKAESVPNVVIESLYWQVPVLSSLYAGMPEMLNAGTAAPAGICVPLNNAATDVRNFSEALTALVDDPLKLASLSGNCKAAFLKFDMNTVAGNYLSVFESCTAKQC